MVTITNIKGLQNTNHEEILLAKTEQSDHPRYQWSYREGQECTFYSGKWFPIKAKHTVTTATNNFTSVYVPQINEVIAIQKPIYEARHGDTCL